MACDSTETEVPFTFTERTALTQALEALTDDTLRRFNPSQRPVQPQEFADLHRNQAELMRTIYYHVVEPDQRSSLYEACWRWRNAINPEAAEEAHTLLSRELTTIRAEFAKGKSSHTQLTDDYAKEIQDGMKVYRDKRIKDSTAFQDFW